MYLTFAGFLEKAKRIYGVRVRYVRGLDGSGGMLLVRPVPGDDAKVFWTQDLPGSQRVRGEYVHAACVALKMKMADFGFLGYS